jgi:hypothetical protein
VAKAGPVGVTVLLQAGMAGAVTLSKFWVYGIVAIAQTGVSVMVDGATFTGNQVLLQLDLT